MTADAFALLRAPFPPECVGYLPRVTCRECRNSRGRSCDRHPRTRCDTCAAYVSPAHIDLAYVGHGHVTDRLLSVDPTWTWEPLALDDRGLPAFDSNGGLWIRLTVTGVTRLGYGHADEKTGGDAVKEIIGDALRNAGMRFGVGLDLWTQDGPTAPSAEASEPAAVTVERGAGTLRSEIAALAERKGYDLTTIDTDFSKSTGEDIRTASVDVLTDYRDQLSNYPHADD